METLQFKSVIHAPREKVWEILWGKESYPAWTAAFCEGSDVKTDWKEGSPALFTGPDGGGISSEIVANRAPEFMSFRHLAELKNWVAVPETPESRQWAGAMENYTLREDAGITEVLVETDVVEEMKDYFIKAWPEALQNVKALAESRSNVSA
jgi:uncharacterized protein YndB with AHSA1/START domain